MGKATEYFCSKMKGKKKQKKNTGKQQMLKNSLQFYSDRKIGVSVRVCGRE